MNGRPRARHRHHAVFYSVAVGDGGKVNIKQAGITDLADYIAAFVAGDFFTAKFALHFVLPLFAAGLRQARDDFGQLIWQ